MKANLTLRIDEELVQKAKSYCARHGVSLTQLVANFLTVYDQVWEERVEPGRRLTEEDDRLIMQECMTRLRL